MFFKCYFAYIVEFVPPLLLLEIPDKQVLFHTRTRDTLGQVNLTFECTERTESHLRAGHLSQCI